MTPNDIHLTLSVLPEEENLHYQVIEFKGDFDKIGLLNVQEQIEATVNKFSGQYLVFNLAELHYINSECIGFLTTIHSRLIKNNKSLVLVQAQPNVKDILSVIGIFMILKNYDSLSSFLETLKK